MMATRAIRPKRDTILTDWQSIPEQAPSDVRQDSPTVARVLAMVGVLLSAIGLLAILAPGMKLNYVVSPGWGGFFLSIGLALLIFHAFADGELQFRMLYSTLALGLAGIACFLRVLPLGGSMGGMFLPVGVPFLMLALFFFLAVLRHETVPGWRQVLHLAVGGLAAAMILAGFGGGQMSTSFLQVEGLLMLILGLFYAAVFLSMFPTGSPAVFNVGLAVGLAGLTSFLLALIRSYSDGAFLVPSGLILMGMGLVYGAFGLGVCSDWPVVVLTRRELAAFFLSPIAYLVVFAMVLMAWLNFMQFVHQLEGLVLEPIVRSYLVVLYPVILQLIAVPLLTMRLMSEENRSGTLEMVLTTPVNESTVTISKFLAAWIFYQITWLPMWIFMVALRLMGGEPFDYRPLLSFYFALAATGAGFIAMGLFFSSVTRNQIVAAVLTFVGMCVHLSFFLVGGIFEDQGMSFWTQLFRYVSFIDLWFSTLDGLLAPRYLVFHLSAAVFFLFLTNKVLESRKWK